MTSVTLIPTRKSSRSLIGTPELRSAMQMFADVLSLIARLRAGRGGETLYLIQSRLSPLEIVGSRVNLHRIQCASWRKRSEDRAWNKTLTKISVSMALDQMISDGVSHDYARYRSLSASMKRSLRRFARQIAIPKPSKMSTKPVDILVENLSRAKSDRADLGIPSPCLKNGQRYNKLIHLVFLDVNHILHLLDCR